MTGFDERRHKVTESVANGLNHATGHGYYAVFAAHLIITELRIMSDVIVTAIRENSDERKSA